MVAGNYASVQPKWSNWKASLWEVNL